MGSRNRNLTEQRDDFLLETNFDDDGALTRAHFNNNRISNNSGMAETRPRPYRSNYSIDRYSDAAKSYKGGQKKMILSEQFAPRTFCVVNQKSTHSSRFSEKCYCCCSLRCVTQCQCLIITPTLMFHFFMLSFCLFFVSLRSYN